MANHDTGRPEFVDTLQVRRDPLRIQPIIIYRTITLLLGCCQMAVDAAQHTSSEVVISAHCRDTSTLYNIAIHPCCSRRRGSGGGRVAVLAGGSYRCSSYRGIHDGIRGDSSDVAEAVACAARLRCWQQQ